MYSKMNYLLLVEVKYYTLYNYYTLYSIFYVFFMFVDASVWYECVVQYLINTYSNLLDL